MTQFRRLLGEAWLAAALFLILVVVSVALTPARFAFGSLGATIGLMAPITLAACAATPVILAGREGIDLSVGPLMALVNVVIVKWLVLGLGISSPLLIVPVALLLGAAGGTVNGLLTVYLRVQPIVATLGTFLVFSGVAVWALPSPTGPAPSWLVAMSEAWSFVPILLVLGTWFLFRRLPLYGYIMAIGGDDRAPYSAGVNVNQVRFFAYVISGLIAGVAGLSLTALLGSADAQVGPTFTLLAIAAAALGGVSLAGGRGGLLGASLGALDIFLLQNLITHFNLSTFFLQILYGLVLVLAVSLNSPRLARYLTSRERVKDA